MRDDGSHVNRYGRAGGRFSGTAELSGLDGLEGRDETSDIVVQLYEDARTHMMSWALLKAAECVTKQSAEIPFTLHDALVLRCAVLHRRV